MILGFYSVILKPAYNFEYDKSYDLISSNVIIK